MLLKDISAKTDISEPVLSTLLNHKKHLWISEDLQDKLEDERIRRTQVVKASQDKNYYIKSPEGKVYQVLNIALFSKEHKLLNTKLNEVLTGKRQQHCGWTRPTEKELNNVCN